MACISKRRGRWVVDYRDTSGKRYRETIDGNRDDAKQRLSEVLKDEGQVTETKQTFKDYGVEWLNTYARTHLKESTFREYEAVFNNHLVPAFGSLAFTKIKRAAVKKLIAEKIRAKKSRSTVRNIIAPLREMFNHAIDDGVASFNPATRVGRFNKRKDGPSLKYSWSGSPLMLVNGSTTMDGRSGRGGSTGGPLIPARSISRPRGRGQLSQIPSARRRISDAVAAATVWRRRLLGAAEMERGGLAVPATANTATGRPTFLSSCSPSGVASMLGWFRTDW